MRDDDSTHAADELRFRWSVVAESLTRPYPVSIPMVLLVSMVPLYIFIADVARYSEIVHMPEMGLDRHIPVQPVWALVYGALYFVLIALPVFVVRQPEHVARTVYAYLMVWSAAYACFLIYPTAAPRGDEVAGEGFGAWGLRLLYSSDPPYNCFPSLHVAHSFVSALSCWRLNRSLGIAALIAAALVGISTLFTKQHYVADVIAGALLAFVAYVLFLRGYPREKVPDLDRRIAPVLALFLLAVAAIMVACAWVAYKVTTVHS